MNFLPNAAGEAGEGWRDCINATNPRVRVRVATPATSPRAPLRSCGIFRKISRCARTYSVEMIRRVFSTTSVRRHLTPSRTQIRSPACASLGSRLWILLRPPRPIQNCGFPALHEDSDKATGPGCERRPFRGTCRPKEISMREMRVKMLVCGLPSVILDEIVLVRRTDRPGAPSNFVFGLAINPSYG